MANDIGLEGELERLAGELSHGQKQWLEIGMLLAQDSQLLLVDEPAAGMTESEREKQQIFWLMLQKHDLLWSSNTIWNL